MREAQAVQPGTVLKSGNLGNQFLKGGLKEEVPTGEPEPVLKSSNLGNLGNPTNNLMNIESS